jgi:hypothetical protein
VRLSIVKELNAISLLQMTIEEASAKVRQDPVIDDQVDYSLPHWAGIVPAQCGWKCLLRTRVSHRTRSCSTISKAWFKRESAGTNESQEHQSVS